jgi:hypothetical protein
MEAYSIVHKVSLTALKRFSVENLPEGSLRDDVLCQPDEVSPEEYLANCRVWLRLLTRILIQTSQTI